MMITVINYSFSSISEILALKSYTVNPRLIKVMCDVSGSNATFLLKLVEEL